MKQSQYLEAFNIQKVLMELTGLWPKKNKFWYTLYGFVMSFVIQALFVLPSVATVFYSTTDVAHASYILFSIITVFTYGMKVIVLYIKRNSFHEILSDLEQPLFVNYNHVGEIYMKKMIWITNAIRKLIQFPCIIFIVFVAVYPILEKQTQRPLPYAMPINVNELHFFLYISVYFLQVLSAGVCACNNGSMDTLACSFMALCTVQLQILGNNLRTAAISLDSSQRSRKSENIVDNFEKYDEEVIKTLKKCAKHHIAIAQYAEKLEGMFTSICLAQFLTSVVVICLAGFSFLVVPVTNVLFGASISYFVAAMVEISLYCIFGDELMIQSVKIGDACYMSEWNNCGPEIRKILLIIMERSKRPLVLTAGKFADLSRTSLLMLCKSSFSYFAVLRKLYGGEN